MPRVTIDNVTTEVREGTTILQAARTSGADVPALCHYEGLPPSTSCMLCVVEIEGRRGVVPACAHLVSDGMIVHTQTPKLDELRRLGLEMLLSDHVGDCSAPCRHACPLDLDVPKMLRMVAAGDLREAVATVRRDMALPSILGRVCPELCERTCRRGVVDQPAAVCRIKQFVADEDTASDDPYLPTASPVTGRRVVVIGAGPAGLSAAYYLTLAGHQCVVIDSRERPGGRLFVDFDRATLPEAVIDAEVRLLRRLGVSFQLGTTVAGKSALAALKDQYDAVLVATGRVEGDPEAHLGLALRNKRVRVDGRTFRTSMAGVFAAGDVVRPTDLVVQCVAAGKRAAAAMDEALSGGVARGRRLDIRTKSPSPESLSLWLRERDRDRPARIDTNAPLTLEDLQCEAERCLGCDCRHREGCLLRRYAERYGATKPRSQTGAPPLERRLVGPTTELEPGKCIRCGICIAIAEARGEPIGLTFQDRGYDLRVIVPFASVEARGLVTSAAECVRACPTGALTTTPTREGISLPVA